MANPSHGGPGWYPPQPVAPLYPNGGWPPIAPRPTPGRGPAITTIVLSFVGVAIDLVMAAMFGFAGLFFIGFGATPDDRVVQITLGIVAAALFGAAVSLVGAILLVRHRRAGRVCAAVGAAVTFLGLLTAIVLLDNSEVGMPWLMIAWLAISVVTIVCALHPSTGQWCEARR